MPYLHLYRYHYFIWLLLKVTLMVIIGRGIGFFDLLDTYAYSQFTQLTEVRYPNPKQFILIDASNVTSPDLVKALSYIDQSHPSRVILDLSFDTTLLEEASLTSILHTPTHILALPYVTFEGRRSLLSGYIDQVGLYDFTALHHGGLYHFESFGGYRPVVFLEGIQNPTIERREGLSVNYHEVLETSKLHLSDLIEGNATPELFRESIVILSNFTNAYLSSPIAKLDSQLLQQLGLAYLIQSEIDGSWHKHLFLGEYIGFMFGLSIFWILIAYFFFRGRIHYLFALSMPFTLLLYWIGLHYTARILPLWELFSAFELITILLFRHWKAQREESEEQILHALSKRLKEKVVYKTFYNSEDYWEEIITLVNQLFNLKKSLFLEKIADQTRLREVASYACDFEDIEESRRDYRREPYASAIKYRITTSPTRRFFYNLSETEEEFIVPLLYHNSVIGFWAFSLEKQELETIRNFESLIGSCAKEMSDLLYHRRGFELRKKRSRFDLKKLFNVEVEHRNTLRLRSNLAIMEKRMLLGEVTMDSMDSHLIVYDLFGKMIEVNRQMSDLLQHEKLSFFTLTASQMLASLTQMNITQTKALIRHVVLIKKKETYFVELKESKQRYLLSISAITQERIAHKFSADYLFGTYGILIELIDVGFVEENYYIKRDVVTHALKEHRHQLERLDSRLSHLPQNGNLMEIVNRMFFHTHVLESLITYNLDTHEKILYPIDIYRNLKQVAKYIMNLYAYKSLKVEIPPITGLPLVTVSPKQVKKMLQSILVLLAEDSEGSQPLTVEIVPMGNTLRLVFKSHGFGLPQEQLAGYMVSSTPPHKYAMLQEAQEAIALWRGSLSYTSKLGEGIVIVVHLKSIFF